MKKILFVMVTSLAISLSGCSNSNAKTENTIKPHFWVKSEDGTYSYEEISKEVVEKLYEEFSKEYIDELFKESDKFLKERNVYSYYSEYLN